LKNKILIVPYSFDDQDYYKVRPVLCLTGAVGEFQHIIVAFISSKEPKEFIETNISINITDFGFQETGLKVTSYVRPYRVVSIPITAIKRELGTLPLSLQQKVTEKIKHLFELA